MAKRKLASKDYNTGDEDSCSSASTWNPSKKRVKGRGRRTKQKGIADHSSSVYVHDGQENLTSVAQSKHAASRHDIVSPASISMALLEWYAGVHESRGMPWRKPYDNSLDPDGRAQRAYEVNSLYFCCIQVY
jgi:A/G-specific adenine glycosylase